MECTLGMGGQENRSHKNMQFRKQLLSSLLKAYLSVFWQGQRWEFQRVCCSPRQYNPQEVCPALRGAPCMFCVASPAVIQKNHLLCVPILLCLFILVCCVTLTDGNYVIHIFPVSFRGRKATTTIAPPAAPQEQQQQQQQQQ